MRSGPDFFRDYTQSGPESQDRTISQSRPDWTAKSYFGLVSKFGTGLLTNRSGPVRSQSLGPVRSVYLRPTRSASFLSFQITQYSGDPEAPAAGVA